MIDELDFNTGPVPNDSQEFVQWLVGLWLEAAKTGLELIPEHTVFPVDAKEVMVLSSGLNAKVVLEFPQLLAAPVQFERVRGDVQAIVRAAYYLGVERGRTEGCAK